MSSQLHLKLVSSDGKRKASSFVLLKRFSYSVGFRLCRSWHTQFTLFRQDT